MLCDLVYWIGLYPWGRVESFSAPKFQKLNLRLALGMRLSKRELHEPGTRTLRQHQFLPRHPQPLSAAELALSSGPTGRDVLTTKANGVGSTTRNFSLATRTPRQDYRYSVLHQVSNSLETASEASIKQGFRVEGFAPADFLVPCGIAQATLESPGRPALPKPYRGGSCGRRQATARCSDMRAGHCSSTCSNEGRCPAFAGMTMLRECFTQCARLRIF